MLFGVVPFGAMSPERLLLQGWDSEFLPTGLSTLSITRRAQRWGPSAIRPGCYHIMHFGKWRCPLGGDAPSTMRIGCCGLRFGFHRFLVWQERGKDKFGYGPLVSYLRSSHLVPKNSHCAVPHGWGVTDPLRSCGAPWVVTLVTSGAATHPFGKGFTSRYGGQGVLAGRWLPMGGDTRSCQAMNSTQYSTQ